MRSSSSIWPEQSISYPNTGPSSSNPEPSAAAEPSRNINSKNWYIILS